jgi:hypothetical protein
MMCSPSQMKKGARADGMISGSLLSWVKTQKHGANKLDNMRSSRRRLKEQGIEKYIPFHFETLSCPSERLVSC